MKEPQIKVEVCVDSIVSALTAQTCGAWRVEFCNNMSEGGITPSVGQIVEIRKKLNIKLNVIIRPRGGDFVYTEEEFSAMCYDVKMCGENRCDGVVIGILTPNGRVDMVRCRVLVDIARAYNMSVTFHRAFDVSENLEEALEDVVALGCDRLLTSGGKATAEEGIEVLAKLMRQAARRIIVMPGSGITPENVAKVITTTGCREIHGTFRSKHESLLAHPAWVDYSRYFTDPDKVGLIMKYTMSLVL